MKKKILIFDPEVAKGLPNTHHYLTWQDRLRDRGHSTTISSFLPEPEKVYDLVLAKINGDNSHLSRLIDEHYKGQVLFFGNTEQRPEFLPSRSEIRGYAQQQDISSLLIAYVENGWLVGE